MTEIPEKQRMDFYYAVTKATAVANIKDPEEIAVAIIDSAKSVTDGQPELLADEMFLFSERLGISAENIKEVLNEYRQHTTEAREAARKEQEKKKQEQQANDATVQLREFIKATNSDEANFAQTAIDAAARLIDELRIKPKEQVRFVTFNDYCRLLKGYNPEKQFRPKLFENIRFPNGTMSLIGARTGRGKTTTLINIARNAIDIERKVLFISLEESVRKIYNRLILSTAYATAQNDGVELMRRDPVTDNYLLENNKSIENNDETAENFIYARNIAYEKIKKAAADGLFLLYDGRAALAQEVLDAIIAQTERGTVVLLDYVQKIPPTGESTDTYRRVADTSNSVLDATLRADAVTICGAQFNRASGYDNDSADKIKDDSFRESGDLEQNAEIAIGIGWEPKDNNRRFYKILKNREGESGTEFYLDFNGAFSFMEKTDQRKKEVTTNVNKGTKQTLINGCKTPSAFD